MSAWALPENWRKGMRPSSRNGNGSAAAASNGANGRSQANGSNSPKVSGNGHTADGKDEKTGASGANGDDLDVRILSMEKTVGTVLYRNILREYGRVNQPKLIRDPPSSEPSCRCSNPQYAGLSDWKPSLSGSTPRPSRRCWPSSKPRL